MKNVNFVTVAPSVERITEGLRDTGYDLNTAVADLIDNAIAANATFIDVRLGLKENAEPVVAVGDNGHGMNESALVDCMRYGSPEQASASRLGKFGMGLKTASTAFCRRVVVASRVKTKAKTVQAAWDLDRLAASGEWQLELGKPGKQAQEYLDACTQKGPGTVVIWEKIDRLLTAELAPNGADSFGEQPDPVNRLERITQSLRDHLALVFQRYLDPAFELTRTVSLHLNGVRISPWNPFVPEYSDLTGTHILTVTQGGETAPIMVTAHLLPREEALPDEAARANARIEAARQGIYVYRENRLIHGPDWLGIHQQNPAWTLLRVSLSFDARIDNVFMVDIKKSRVLINEHLYAWLKNAFLPALLQKAEERWRQGAAETTRKTAQMRHSVSDQVICRQRDSLRKAEILELHPQSGEAQVRNNTGTAMARLAIINAEQPELAAIFPSTGMPDGVLWEPAVINGAPAVKLNVAHPFYSKVYVPNEQNSTLIQALDSLLWSLAQAEVNNLSTDSRDQFAAMRAELARNLAKLMHDLPE